MKQNYFDSTEEYADVLNEIQDHAEQAHARYANFASAHEALGVALEEWNELQDAIRSNAIESIREEAIDLAAVMIRLAVQCRQMGSFRVRSVK